MRSLPGFDRAAVQWAFTAASIVLVGVTILVTLEVRRRSDDVRMLTKELEGARAEISRLEGQLVRERSTREALALELGRRRDPSTSATPPSLTLYPESRRTGQPPAASLAAPGPDGLIQLRLVLPAAVRVEATAPLDLALRDWSSGKVMWTRGNLRPDLVEHRSAVSAYVSGDLLASGAYELVLRNAAGDAIASYELVIQ